MSQAPVKILVLPVASRHWLFHAWQVLNRIWTDYTTTLCVIVLAGYWLVSSRIRFVKTTNLMRLDVLLMLILMLVSVCMHVMPASW